MPSLVGDQRLTMAGATIPPEWIGSVHPFPRRSLAEVFGERCHRWPHAIAVSTGQDQLTYRDLDRRSSQVARLLLAHGVRPGDAVGLCLARRPEAIVTMLAIIKAGAAYVAVDPGDPGSDQGEVLDDAQVQLVCTDRDLCGPIARGRRCLPVTDLPSLAGGMPPTCPEGLAQADSCACLRYVAQAVGPAVGIAIPHRAILRLILGQDYVRLGRECVLLQAASLASDASLFEIWGALLTGGRLVLLAPSPTDAAVIATAISTHGITTTWLTPGTFQEMLDHRMTAFNGLHQVLVGGQPLPAVQIEHLLETHPGLLLVHGYGPAENTTLTCCHLMQGPQHFDFSVPIGRPIANSYVRLLDADLAPVAAGSAGELFIGGEGLALGYHHRPQLTAERFIRDPLSESGARLFRTGDRARYRTDGAIELLGRMEPPIWIGGHCIEPSDVEHVVRRHAQVRDVAVCARSSPDGAGPQLVAYVVARPHATPTPELEGDLRTLISRRLPAHQVPARVLLLPGLPVTKQGMLDRSALPDPFTTGAGLLTTHPSRAQAVFPSDPLQRDLCDLWTAVLPTPPATELTSFVASGGTSLQALRLLDGIHRRLNASIDLSDFCQDPTIAGLSLLVRRGWMPRSRIVRVRTSGTRGAVFVCAPSIDLARYVPEDRPLYLLGQPADELDDRVQLTATDLIEAIMREMLPLVQDRPVVLGGHRSGALLALASAQRLEDIGCQVERVILIDPPILPQVMGAGTGCSSYRHDALQLLWSSPARHLRSALSTILSGPPARERELTRLLADFVPSIISAPMELYFPRDSSLRRQPQRDPRRVITTWTRGQTRVHDVAGDHLSICWEPHLSALGTSLRQVLSAPLGP